MKKTIAERLDQVYEKQFVLSAKLEFITKQIRTLELIEEKSTKPSKTYSHESNNRSK